MITCNSNGSSNTINVNVNNNDNDNNNIHNNHDDTPRGATRVVAPTGTRGVSEQQLLACQARVAGVLNAASEPVPAWLEGHWVMIRTPLHIRSLAFGNVTHYHLVLRPLCPRCRRLGGRCLDPRCAEGAGRLEAPACEPRQIQNTKTFKHTDTLSLSLSLYIYIYIYMRICFYTC